MLRAIALVVAVLMAGCANLSLEAEPAKDSTLQIWSISSCWDISFDVQLQPISDLVSRSPSGAISTIHFEEPPRGDCVQTPVPASYDPTCEPSTQGLYAVVLANGRKITEAVQGGVRCGDGTVWRLYAASGGDDDDPSKGGIFGFRGSLPPPDCRRDDPERPPYCGWSNSH